MSTLARFAALLFALTLSLPTRALAQDDPVYVQFQPSAVKGVIYRPPGGGRPEIGLLVIHRVNNFLGHGAGRELARRGFAVLAMNSRFDNNETAVIWEQIALDVKTGVEFMKKQMGVRTVLLFGHSGGATTLSFYQAVAEQGAAFCNAPTKIVSCGADYPSLPRADGLILVDANLSNAVGLLRGLNPAVGADDDPRITQPDLDPFNPANGYNPNGPSSYSDEFKRRYFAAQAARMARLVADASARAAKLGPSTPLGADPSGGLPRAESRGGRFPDDDVVLIARARGGSLGAFDPTLARGLEQPRKVLKINGRIVTEKVTNMQPFTPPGPSGGTFAEASLLTLRSFLTTHAVRATDSRAGVDWCSTNNSTPCALQQIRVPVLITAMQGGNQLGDSEMIYEMAASKDKDFVIVEGASHNIIPCTECERRKGEFDNTVKNFFDYVRRWIEARY